MRKTIHSAPVVTIHFNARGLLSADEAQRIGNAIRNLVTMGVSPHAWGIAPVALGSSPLDVEVAVEHEHRCEFCNGAWIGATPDWNGDCCARDSANDPNRLQALRALARDLEGEDCYRYDAESRRTPRVTSDWPPMLANATMRWLNEGRPASGAGPLRAACLRVEESEWCTVWEDPGNYPSGAGGSPLPDSVTRDYRPDELAAEIRRMLDDLGFTEATAAADDQRRMEAAMGPRENPAHPMFRDHNCWKCDSGAKPCATGNPSGCEFPRARND